MANMRLEDAEKIQQHLRAGLWGGEKMGKTHGALALLSSRLGPEKIAQKKLGAISTEHGSTSLLAGIFPHRCINLAKDAHGNDMQNPFTIERHLDALDLLQDAGCEGIILDSGSHIWNGAGGALDMVSRTSGNKFTNGWGTQTPLYDRFIQKLLGYPGDVVVTFRAKEKHEVRDVQVGDKIKSIPQNIGEKPITRPGTGHELQYMIHVQNQIGYITASATQHIIPNDFVISDWSKFADLTFEALAGAPPREPIPTFQSVYEAGKIEKRWLDALGFCKVASQALGIDVNRQNVSKLTSEQYGIIGNYRPEE